MFIVLKMILRELTRNSPRENNPLTSWPDFNLVIRLRFLFIFISSYGSHSSQQSLTAYFLELTNQ